MNCEQISIIHRKQCLHILNNRAKFACKFASLIFFKFFF